MLWRLTLVLIAAAICVAVQPSDRAFVGEWYHAVSAYLFSTGKYGDSARHLRDVLLLPSTARPTAVDCPVSVGVKCTPVTTVDRVVLGFDTYLVAGRIASARGRYEEAPEHYRAASAIFARAQSALLGASHAALMLADVPETLSPLEQLEDGGNGATADGLSARRRP